MPEQNNDRLEQFFRKAASRADVSYNEDDWKKLEAKLDAADVTKAAGARKASRTTAAIVVGTVLLVSTALWVNYHYDLVPHTETAARVQDPATIIDPTEAETDNSNDEAIGQDESEGSSEVEGLAKPTTGVNGKAGGLKRIDNLSSGVKPDAPSKAESREGVVVQNDDAFVATVQSPVEGVEESSRKDNTGDANIPDFPVTQSGLMDPDGRTDRSVVTTERDKQEAVVVLPGAEEEDTRGAEAMVEEEHASDQKKHVATPRLSLLLFFAPDFSGTSMGSYSAPGKAFGGMIHYHPFSRWSISAGVIKNHKQYTGAGEDYKPPKGYWKYYTNGIIPESIDGSCSILEFPLMVQYTLFNSGKNKWVIGGGASSYLMQSESYRYYFDQPNPGAKQGWDSRGPSHNLFNMVNFTFGYERRIFPNLMIGIEPYAKIPLEEIGWSNLRLFSTGASFTLRYTVLRKQEISIHTRSRGPD